MFRVNTEAVWGMRLIQLKLSGFKSFLEPTTLTLNTSLTGIVGPNGCGKSNIVDAIRWVIGESSAKQLRGENLSDVIFGGSSARKPIGKAQVELIFDNSENRLGGRFSGYHQLSIKREITRETGSTYFLNQSPCRRRDIMDILLGTGLGPRSYAVIEQGMISHLISATPEELRAYLEEAAMVSKYKERRKEAESRMLQTRDNLLRIQDLTVEIEEQLEKIKIQAEIAQTYKAWKKSAQWISAQLEALEIHHLQKKIQHIGSSIQAKEIRLASHLEEDIKIDQEQEQLLAQQAQEAEKMTAEQNEYYQLSIEISRVEQSLKDSKIQAQRIHESVKQFERNYAHLSVQREQDQGQQALLEKHILEQEPLLNTCLAELTASQHHLAQTQGAWKAWQQQWEQFSKNATQARQSQEIKKNQLQQLERLKSSLNNHYERLKQEKQQSEAEIQADQILQWENELNTLETHIQEKNEDLCALNLSIETKQQALYLLDSTFNEYHRMLQKREAEKASLQSLQQLILSEQKYSSTVLESLNLPEKSVIYLAQTLKSVSGWEQAIEVVLKDLLNALCVSHCQDIMAAIPQDQGISLVELDNSYQPLFSLPGDRLAHKLLVRSAVIDQHLLNIYTADTLEEAFQQLSNLKTGESIVTREGVWLGIGWVKTPNKTDKRLGVLMRQQRMDALEQEIREEQAKLSTLSQNKARLSEQVSILKEQQATCQIEQKQMMDQKTQIIANVNAKKRYLEQVQARTKRIQEEVHDLEKQLSQCQIEYEEAQQGLTLLDAEVARKQQEEQALQAQKKALQDEFEGAKTALHHHEHQVQQVKSIIDSSQKQRHYLETQILRTQEQLQGFEQQLAWLKPQLNEITTLLPTQETHLAAYIEKRQISSHRLNALKANHAITEERMTGLKKKYQEQKHSIEALRKALERLRIDHESLNVQQLNRKAQITQLGLVLEEVIQSLPKDANPSDWKKQLSDLHNQIQGLGEVNLAATQEYEALVNRKEHVDKQSQDLVDALNTLEEAIQKIDQETGLQLKKTFEQVNQHFMNLFSKIFEGGSASLELTETNWLSTGILVKAQPKGKRNATIHLLSGGEKALTAIALVFAFFQLNPAPFCILDEVDAPLDDHNIGRFCQLVADMSTTLQFIFISHSKVTLTMAKQLVGVTMREAGVSRIVSVNIEEAVKLASQAE